MPNPWMPGLNHDPGRGAGYPVAQTRMQFVVHHDTAGTNSYNICKWGRDGYQTSLCQILLPKVGVPWQFCEIDSLCYHAGNAQYGDYNPYGPGFEVERLGHEEALSPDQVHWLHEINAWMSSEWGVPNVQYRGPQFGADGFHGHVNHSDLHPNPDGLTYAEWDLVTGAAEPEPKLPQEDEMYLVYGPVFGRIGNVAHLVAGSLILDEWSEDKGGGLNGIPVTLGKWNAEAGRGFTAKRIGTAQMKKLRVANGLAQP